MSRDCNIRVGMMILRDELDRFGGDERLALLAYNRGAGAVLADLRNGLSPSNGYEHEVLRRRAALAKTAVAL